MLQPGHETLQLAGKAGESFPGFDETVLVNVVVLLVNLA